MQRGGCHPDDGCETGHRFQGADFKFLAANVVRKDDAKTLFRPYAIRRFQGKKIGFIGMTLEGTPSIVSPSGISNLSFLDEAATANRYARELRRKHGVKAIVVLLHEGGVADRCHVQHQPGHRTRAASGITGPIVDIVSNTTDDVDLFITGHTHQPYDCVIDGRPVTSSSSFGRLAHRHRPHDRPQRRRQGRAGQQHPDVRRRPHAASADVDELVKFYEELLGGRSRRDRGRPDRERTSRGRPIPTTVARERARQPDRRRPARRHRRGRPRRRRRRADEPGRRARRPGLRAQRQPDGGRHRHLRGGVHRPAVQQPRDHPDVHGRSSSSTCSRTSGAARPRPTCCCRRARSTTRRTSRSPTSILGQPCAGAPNPVSGVTIGGVALDPAASYRITTNNFLADGGDDFPSLTAGTNRTTLSEGGSTSTRSWTT